MLEPPQPNPTIEDQSQKTKPWEFHGNSHSFSTRSSTIFHHFFFKNISFRSSQDSMVHPQAPRGLSWEDHRIRTQRQAFPALVAELREAFAPPEGTRLQA